MEITKTHEFFTKIYGSSPAKGYQGVLEDYIGKEVDKDLLSFADQNKKKAQTIEDMVVDILSLFHRDKDGSPIIGNWMARKCMIDTGEAIFNAVKNKDHPKKALIPMAIKMVEPIHIRVNNGGPVEKPDGIDTYAVTITKPTKRSFFKAYEYINAGVTAECTYYIDEDIISEELANYWIEKSGLVGWGAFRERFGKFSIV